MDVQEERERMRAARMRTLASAAAPFLREWARDRVARVLGRWLDADGEPSAAESIGVRAEIRAIRDLCIEYHAHVDIAREALGDDGV